MATKEKKHGVISNNTNCLNESFDLTSLWPAVRKHKLLKINYAKKKKRF